MVNSKEALGVIYGSKSFKKINQNFFSVLPDLKGSAYDNKARLYEKLVSIKLYNKIIWGTLPQDYIDFAKKSILNFRGVGIDIGCGGLVQTAEIYATSKEDYILIDNSIEMLKIANQRLISLCGDVPKNIKLLQADAFHLPFDNNSFDNLVSFGMIHCFENKSNFIKESLRVLKLGGTFHFTSMTSDRLIGRLYMNLLRKQKEFGEPLYSKDLLKLFKDVTKLNYYIKGNMIFISGIK